MKIALISDIHANMFYFTHIIEDIKTNLLDKIICLGDLVGYYDEPNEVIDFCRKNKIDCIMGNHEEYILGTLNYKNEKENIYRIKAHKKMLTKENSNFIKNLPKEIIIRHKDTLIYCTHALPDNSSKYLYNPNNIEDEHIVAYDYYCSGHTHIPYIQYKYGTCIVNPGSVGQPRDYTALPSYAIIDLEKNEVSLKKVTLDINLYQKQLKKLGLNPKLLDILQRTRK